MTEPAVTESVPPSRRPGAASGRKAAPTSRAGRTIGRATGPSPATPDPDVRLLAALADPVRLGIVRQIADCGSVCVCDLDACRRVSQPTVSHHLRVLREAGVVRAERRGTWIYYSLDADALERLAVILRSLQPPSAVSPAEGARGRRLPVADASAPR